MAGRAELRPSQLRAIKEGADPASVVVSPAMRNPINNSSRGRVVLNVGGTRFETTPETLKCFPPDSLIGRAFSGTSVTLQRDSDGSFFFDRDGRAFGVLLQSARTGTAPTCPVDMPASDWVGELQYWGMTGDQDSKRDEELQERKRRLDSKINDSRLRKVRTIFLILSKRSTDATKSKNLGFEFVVPKEPPVKEFDCLYKEIDKDRDKYELPSSFSWAEALGTKEIRAMIRKSGFVVRVKQQATRFRVSRAHHYFSLKEMLGERSKKTVTVMRLSVEPTTAANDEDSDVLNEFEANEKPKKKQRTPAVPAAPAAAAVETSEASSDSEESSSIGESKQPREAPDWNDGLNPEPEMYTG